MNITYQTALGQRGYQEDRYIAERLVLPNGHDTLTVLAVMDGHGGSETSEFLSKSFISVLAKIAIDPKPELPNWRETLAITMTLLGEMTKTKQSGSTVSAVFLPSVEQKAYVAVVGDSPVIIKDSEGNINVSPEHNARSNARERDAAISRGASFDGTYLYSPESGHGLQMSRAFGDSSLASFIDRTPELYTVDLNQDSFVVVATDGLLDPSHATTEKQASRIANLVNNGADANALVEDALLRQTGDNVTAIIAKEVLS
ncbi:MAG TPA: PP2C family serine/threonine-protein phosphatase [Candidatus Saccharimonadales bacterium]|nr:PP2C family serine/threonine-protein phosphatase [Candidatus Saccharimonadales bacterium]